MSFLNVHIFSSKSFFLTILSFTNKILREFLVVFSDNNPPHDNNKCIQLPTSIENLIDLVVDNGDAYEETLRGYKNQLHPALW